MNSASGVLCTKLGELLLQDLRVDRCRSLSRPVEGQIRWSLRSRESRLHLWHSRKMPFEAQETLCDHAEQHEKWADASKAHPQQVWETPVSHTRGEKDQQKADTYREIAGNRDRVRKHKLSASKEHCAVDGRCFSDNQVRFPKS